MSKLSVVQPKSASEKRTHTVVDTIMVTPESVAQWRIHTFQRPIKTNKKVLALAEKLKEDDGVWPGIITLGVLDDVIYLIDGQHRREAFLISKLKVGYTDVRTLHVSSFGEMGDEFVLLNSQLVRMQPDDLLRALEDSTPNLRMLRTSCPVIGYGSVRRSSEAPMVSMSAVLRMWRGSANGIPSNIQSGITTSDLATTLTDEDAIRLIEVIQIFTTAFGREPQYWRMWGSLNMVLCMWIYRNMVLSQYSSKTPRLTRDMFRKCLMSLSADEAYSDWLVGRSMGDRDRSPAYARIKSLFAKRLEKETGQSKVYMPAPSWFSGGTQHFRESQQKDA